MRSVQLQRRIPIVRRTIRKNAIIIGAVGKSVRNASFSKGKADLAIGNIKAIAS
jgi:hypothetical protein